MSYTYTSKEITDPITNETFLLVFRSDGAIIPGNLTNSDYQRYLRWLEDPTAEESGTLS